MAGTDWRRKYTELQAAVAEYKKYEGAPVVGWGPDQDKRLVARHAMWKAAGLPYTKWILEGDK